jgi:hypothetical protein
MWLWICKACPVELSAKIYSRKRYAVISLHIDSFIHTLVDFLVGW